MKRVLATAALVVRPTPVTSISNRSAAAVTRIRRRPHPYREHGCRSVCSASSTVDYRQQQPQPQPPDPLERHRQVYHSTGDGKIVFGSLLYRAHQLLDHDANNDVKNNNEEWTEDQVLDCVHQLSSARTRESVDLSLLLLDKLIGQQRQQHQRSSNIQTSNSTNASEDGDAAGGGLLDRNLWHSVLLNWQQVNREFLDGLRDPDKQDPKYYNRQRSYANTTPRDQKNAPQDHEMDRHLTSPEKLLALLDGWSEQLVVMQPQQKQHINPEEQQTQTARTKKEEGVVLPDEDPPFVLVTNKALSLMIDVTARRGKQILEDMKRQKRQDEPNQQRLRDTAQFAENCLFRMLDKYLQAQQRQQKQEQQLSEIDDEYEDEDEPEIVTATHHVKAFCPSVDNLNAVLWLVAQTGQAERAWQILRRVVGQVRPNIFSYNVLLTAYSKTGDGAAAENVLMELCQTASQVLSAGESSDHHRHHRVGDRHNRGDELDDDDDDKNEDSLVVTPDVTCWNLVLAAWAKAPDKKLAAERVEQLLVTMMMSSSGSSARSTMDTAPSPTWPLISASIRMPAGHSVQPDLTTFNTALSAYARAGEAETCARLLGEMQDLFEAGRLASPPDAISYSTVMNAFAKAGRPDMAEAYLEDMYAAFMQHGMEDMRPTLPILTSVLDAYSKSIAKAVCIPDNAATFKLLERARLVFQRLRTWHEYGFLPTRAPDVTAYNVMMGCYLRASHAKTAPVVNKSAEHADALLRALQADPALRPDFSSYSIVIQAWLNRPDGLPRAVELLDEMWEIFQSETNPAMKPDSKSLHSIIVGLSRNSGKPEVAQQLLLRVCEARRLNPSRTEAPLRGSFGSVVGSWIRSDNPKAAVFAQSLVDQMEHYQRIGVLTEGPDRLIYSTVLNCWAHSNLSDAGHRAHTILTKMRDLAKSTGDQSMLPDDPITYNNVILAFSKGKVHPYRAEQVLREMYDDFKQGLLPSSSQLDIKCFNTALSAWARSHKKEAMERAEALFREIQQLHARGKVQCDTATFNIMLNVLAESRSRRNAERAEGIVMQMMTQSRGDGGGKTKAPMPRPNAITYGSLIKAWVRLGDADRAERVLAHLCQEYLQHENEDMKPQRRHFELVEKAMSAFHGDPNGRRQRITSLMEMKRRIIS